MLANDTDADGDTLTVDQLNGTGGSPRHRTSAKGAAVTVNGDGSFSYDPTGSATLAGHSRAGRRRRTPSPTGPTMGTAGRRPATVTITVTGAVNHPPVANPDGYPANNNATLTKNAAAGCWPTTPIATATR